MEKLDIYRGIALVRDLSLKPEVEDMRREEIIIGIEIITQEGTIIDNRKRISSDKHLTGIRGGVHREMIDESTIDGTPVASVSD